MFEPQHLKLIIFDMDGLMFDTEKISYKAWREAALLYNFTIDAELFKKTIGTNLARTHQIYYDHFGCDFPFDAIKEERVRLSNDWIEAEGVPVKEGLYELLEYLKTTSYKLAVATSTSRTRAVKLLKLAGVYNCFDYVLCGDEVTHSKPDPEIFLKTAHQLQCKPDQCLVLEDSILGITAARHAGMYTIMVPDVIMPREDQGHLIDQKMDSLLAVCDFLKSVSSNAF